MAAATTEARVVSAAAAAAAGAAAAAVTEAATEAAVPDADPAPEASVYVEPRPFGEHDPAIDGDDWDDTVRADGGPQAKRIPGFLDPGRPIDAVQMSETGSLAEHLGLDRNDDEQTDVGPVR